MSVVALAAVCLGLYTVRRADGQEDCFKTNICVIAGDTFARPEGDVVAADDLIARDDLVADDDVVAKDDLRVFGDEVRALNAEVRARSVTVGYPDITLFWSALGEDGEVVAESVVSAPRIRSYNDPLRAQSPALFRERLSVMDGGDISAGNSITVGRPDPDLRPGITRGEGNIVAQNTVLAQDISALGTISGEDGCSCGGLTIPGDVELSATDNQPPASFAEWGGRNRSSAYEAFRQLPVHTNPHNRLTLAAQDVSRLFPSAVGAYEDNHQPKKGGKGRPTKRTTIDLTQLIFTQMSVIQDLQARASVIPDLQARIARLENALGGHQGRGGKKGKGAGGPPSVAGGKGGNK
ncbi:unnamed protein product [Vitrella brassicaformis CCMP3155]|uniref:Peptidase S74 domain-containing protein n=1 Tax=Vitrella brassicaformis (strain CCMP3155) TaxID=1169540 RepID=A0A0G4EUV1_VITBC|nr:unnamed protein product [Vitrella brassicaformis CCMP3155]|eukprot:CEM02029.1 unnamed protein product [Vitrella brassicaformis CCMP3155]